MSEPVASAASRCDSCRWWDNPWSKADDTSFPSHFDEPADDTAWGVCRLIRHPGRDDGLPRPVRAFTADGSDYWSALSTRSDFGCVLWEPNGRDRQDMTELEHLPTCGQEHRKGRPGYSGYS